MFTEYYHFTKLFEKPKVDKYLLSTSTYQFETEQNKYLVNVEHYRFDIYIIKFCLKRHKNNNKRYNLLSHEGKCTRIVGTCMQIMLKTFKKNPKASFGFLGAHTVDLSKKKEESRVDTKRFRVYKYAIEDFFGTETFSHYMNKENSTYLLVNNNSENTDEVSFNADKMFLEIYPQLEGI